MDGTRTVKKLLEANQERWRRKRRHRLRWMEDAESV
jgi:hypothetical protein